MQTATIASVIICLGLLELRSVLAHAIVGQEHVVGGGGEEVGRIDAEGGAAVVGKDAEARVLDLESIFGGIAKSMVSRTGGTSSQLLSLNLSNVVLMLVLKGLIWGASYMQGNKGRNEDGPAAVQDAGFSETDLLLFLGYMVADDSGRNDCLNRVACEHPARAEGYLRSAEMVWKTVKMLDGVVPLDEKYEQILIKLQEAIEDGRADGDCQAKYKCSDSTNTEEEFNKI